MAKKGEDNQSADSVASSEGGVRCECNKECYERIFLQPNIYWRTFGLSVIVFIYLLVGAAIFSALERPNEVEENDEIEETNENYTRMMEELVNVLTNYTNMTREQSTAFIDGIANAAIGASREPTDNWEFGSSFFFVITVVTTIGYGVIAPRTRSGQRFFIFYALVGIPITLAMLASIGELLKKLMTWLSSPVHKKFNLVKVKFMVIGSFLAAGIVLFIIIPAIIFSIIQDWSYFESVYYCFVTLTTVGFGDFVPSVDSSSNLNGLYRVCVSFWIFIGLAFLSLVISLVQETFKKATKRLRDKKCTCLPFQHEGHQDESKDVTSVDEKQELKELPSTDSSEKESSAPISNPN